MKYCVQYARNFRHLKEVDEIILFYDGTGNLVEFINNTFDKSQRIIIDISDIREPDLNNAVPAINLLKHEGWNITLRISFNQEIDAEFNETIPFFFNKFPKNMEEVYMQAAAGVSDIYITESLGFNMKALKRIKDKFKVKYRVFPNIAQSSSDPDKAIPAMQKFFIRPEDTELYEEYIDVFEILGGKDLSRLSVVYEIYKQRQWLGNLNDLILDFEKEPIVNNKGIDPRFGFMRIDCNKSCLEDKCTLCTEMATLADLFTEVGIEVIKKRYKPERTEEEKEQIMNRLRREDGSQIIEKNLPSN